jgi:hypothetical protein
MVGEKNSKQYRVSTVILFAYLFYNFNLIY